MTVKKNQPLLSVVIANYNYGRFLEDAIKSVLSQSCQDFELIIVDGGSIDNSVEVIKKYADKITWWVSEKDKGQSEAFNKGFSHAKGRFLTWLNADDILLPGAIERLNSMTIKYPECEWWVGGCLWLDVSRRVIKCVRARPFSKLRKSCGMVSAWGPSCYFTKEMLMKVGGVDERFHYMMDSDLWLKYAMQLHKEYRVVNGYAYGLRLHPDAKMSGHNFVDSPQNNPMHKKWNQLKKEREWMLSQYDIKSFSLLKRMFSMGWCAYLRGCIDLLRIRGKKI